MAEPRIPPKVPPPPNLQPPPYTPYDPRLSLLQNDNADNAGRHPPAVRPVTNVVQPTGFRRAVQHCTKRNCIIVIFVLLLLTAILGALNLWYMFRQQENGMERKQLEYSSRTLARFQSPDMRLNYDEGTDAILLSKFNKTQRQMTSLKLNVEQFDVGFLSARQDIDNDNYEDCMRFTSDVFCCVTPPSGKHFKTDCWNRDPAENTVVKSHAPYYDFHRDWQSLEDGIKAVILHNGVRHSVLDLNANKIYSVNADHKYASHGFYFPHDDLDELSELVLEDGRWRICEFRLHLDEYNSKHAGCKELPFELEFELPHVKFCANPIYTAVLQYGHRRNDDMLTWQLSVKYDSLDVIYHAADELHSPNDQVAIDCNNEVIDLYALAAMQAVQFTVNLPSEYSRRLRTRRFATFWSY